MYFKGLMEVADLSVTNNKIEEGTRFPRGINHDFAPKHNG